MQLLRKRKEIFGSNLIQRHQYSCGCQRIKVATKHGKAYDDVYSIWCGMKQRCLNQNHTGYKDYGGRGIKICEEWLDFNVFYNDMGDRQKDYPLIELITIKDIVKTIVDGRIISSNKIINADLKLLSIKKV